MNHASLGKRGADRLGHGGRHHLAPEIQRVLQFGEVHRSRRDVLPVHRQLRLSVALKAADFAGRFQLLHGVVPIPGGLAASPA